MAEVGSLSTQMFFELPYLSRPVAINIYLQNNMCKINNLKVLKRVKATCISIYRSSRNPKCLDKTKLYSLGNPIGMRYNVLCTQTINPLLPAKFIHPREIGKLEEHAGKFRRSVTEWK